MTCKEYKCPTEKETFLAGYKFGDDNDCTPEELEVIWRAYKAEVLL